jgi:hypothetical protein
MDDRRLPRGQPAERQRIRPLPVAVLSGGRHRDTVLLGFGLEQVASPAERATLIGKALGHVLG